MTPLANAIMAMLHAGATLDLAEKIYARKAEALRKQKITAAFPDDELPETGPVDGF